MGISMIVRRPFWLKPGLQSQPQPKGGGMKVTILI